MTGPLTDEEVLRAIGAVPHWYHRIDIRPGVRTPGSNDCQLNLAMLQLPENCAGLRVLDVGTRDGFFAFEMEKRGAEVLAVDVQETGFSVAARLLGSRVPFMREDLFNLNPARIGMFDIVLFLGILYHLPDPIAGLRIVHGLCRERMYLETLVIDDYLLMEDGSVRGLAELNPLLASIPIMRFYPGDVCNHDSSNFWGPNVQCVRDMLGETGFSVVREVRSGSRAIFECVRS